MTLSLVSALERELCQRLPAALQSLLNPAPIQPLHCDLFQQHQIQVDVLRCDLLHPVISGNKWYKLKYNLVRAWQNQQSVLASFGGAWSNHLHALAFCAREAGLGSLGFVRGDELNADANPMLQDAASWGMELQFLSRSDYRQRKVSVDANILLIPEGGDNPDGVLGASTLVPAAANHDVVVLPSGTGCTALGVRLALPATTVLWVVPALKAPALEAQWRQRLQQWQKEPCGEVRWLGNAHFGGYGKKSAELLSFVQNFGENTGLLLDPVYSGKAMWALCQQICQQTLPPASRVLFIHTGGLQGARGFQSRQNS